MKNKINLQDLILMALCCDIGLAAKKIIAPVTNILTDFIRIPGGSAASGFSMMFLVLGAAFVKKRGAATMMGLVQGMLALFLGLSGYQGIWCIITYTAPGLAIDLFGLYKKDWETKTYFMGSCAAANVTGALLSAFLVFHFSLIPYLLWTMLAVLSGLLAGYTGYCIYIKMDRALHFEHIENTEKQRRMKNE